MSPLRTEAARHVDIFIGCYPGLAAHRAALTDFGVAMMSRGHMAALSEQIGHLRDSLGAATVVLDEAMKP